MSKKVLSPEAKMYLECAMNCVDVYELQESYFPNSSLGDLREALEFVGFNDVEYGELASFIAGMNYQKRKQAVSKK